VIRANKQKWRRTMSLKEIEMVEAAVAPMLRQLGHGTITGQRRIGRLEKFYRTRLEPLPYRALSMLRNRRGQAEGLARLVLRTKRWRSMISSSRATPSIRRPSRRALPPIVGRRTLPQRAGRGPRRAAAIRPGLPGRRGRWPAGGGLPAYDVTASW
jgi:hypothetical protein